MKITAEIHLQHGGTIILREHLVLIQNKVKNALNHKKTYVMNSQYFRRWENIKIKAYRPLLYI